MKLIIVEGPDNCGKDTLIQKIMENFPTMTVIHCSKPLISKYSSSEQDLLFQTYVQAIVDGKYDHTHCVLMNRGFHGEYVYGRIYRHRSKESVLNMIDKLENQLMNHCKDNDNKVCYIQLMSSSLDLLVKNEDNKSLSLGNKELINNEVNSFFTVYNNSILPKKMIYIDERGEFRSRESIYNEAMSFINKTLDI